MTNNTLDSIIENFANSICDEIRKNLSEEVGIEEIKKSNRRGEKPPIYSKKGSFIYYLYNEEDNIIYIGESGVSVKRRLFGDGSGAHCHKEWFHEVKYVKYYKNDDMDKDTRKLIERALIYKYGRDKSVNLYNED